MVSTGALQSLFHNSLTKGVIAFRFLLIFQQSPETLAYYISRADSLSSSPNCITSGIWSCFGGLSRASRLRSKRELLSSLEIRSGTKYQNLTA